MKRNPARYSVYLFVLMSLTSCVSQHVVIGPTGDTATVSVHGTSSFVAELLMVSDSTLYFYVEALPATERIIDVPVDSIEAIDIMGYTNKKWIAAVLAFEVVPAVLLGIAAAQVEDSGAGGVFAASMIPAAVTTLAFATSTGQAPKVRAPISSGELEELRKYARFPQGLMPDQLEHLLRVNGQREVQ